MCRKTVMRQDGSSPKEDRKRVQEVAERLQGTVDD